MSLPLTTRSVLVVDDDRQLCDLLAEILTEAGYTVHCAHDGEAAWLEIQMQPLDLILSDITMPRLDGISLARRLVETGSSIPIILMSSAVTAVAGVNGTVVRKPFAIDGLLARIASVLDDRDAATVGTPR
jgi:DNA-binding response OmpR family regulator